MRKNFIHKQEGAALVIGLLILLMASFLAVASLNNATVQERMARNEQNINKAFQAAESAVEQQLSIASEDKNLTKLVNAYAEYERTQINGQEPSWPSADYDSGEADVSTNVKVKSLGKATLVSGEALNADEKSSKISSFRYEFESTATISGSGARISIVQGINYR